MKNLLYKEFKLVMHPVIFVFILAFPILAIFPNYPKFIAFIYIFTCYPIVFIGANKGVSSNDVFYSLTLPVRRKDIVLARLSFLTILGKARYSYISLPDFTSIGNIDTFS